MKYFIRIVLAFLIALPVFAGDMATFVNLGFSEDSKYFMFGQYGIQESSKKPFAQIITVNLDINDYVAKGFQQLVSPAPADPGQDGSGAFYSLLHETGPLQKQYKVVHTKTGRPIFILLSNENPKSSLDLRDFITGNQLKAQLIQKTEGTGKTVKSNFNIQLTVTASDGKAKNYIVGNPTLNREGVKKYSIKSIIAAPDNKTLVFVIQRDEETGDGANIRYMVEVVKL